MSPPQPPRWHGGALGSGCGPAVGAPGAPRPRPAAGRPPARARAPSPSRARAPGAAGAAAAAAEAWPWDHGPRRRSRGSPARSPCPRLLPLAGRGFPPQSGRCRLGWGQPRSRRHGVRGAGTPRRSPRPERTEARSHPQESASHCRCGTFYPGRPLGRRCRCRWAPGRSARSPGGLAVCFCSAASSGTGHHRAPPRSRRRMSVAPASPAAYPPGAGSADAGAAGAADPAAGGGHIRLRHHMRRRNLLHSRRRLLLRAPFLLLLSRRRCFLSCFCRPCRRQRHAVLPPSSAPSDGWPCRAFYCSGTSPGRAGPPRPRKS
mmetsp:Transcript_133558/g.426926  ORF Transcript_133558/g.426926 Transcript_133558/m.426926 type:complete len:318 (-) Transcript_133558:469-1422(-)